jgi:hypothetical protein
VRKLIAQGCKVTGRAFVILSFRSLWVLACKRIERFEAPQFGKRLYEACEKPRVALDVFGGAGRQKPVNFR